MKSPILGHGPHDSATFRLAALASDLDYESIPEMARERAKDILLDSIASAVAGRHGDETALISATAHAAFGSGDSTVVAGEPLSLLGSVLINGYEITALTMCDMHVAALNHVTPSVVSAALAMAEREGSPGRDLVRAVLVGLETSVRIGLSINFEAFRERGWHAPGVIGPFGAANAASSILGLDRATAINALGLAGSQSAGTYAAWGTPTVKFHQTRGGVSGVLGALLASEGFQASQDIITHPDGGLFSTYTEGASPERLVEGLGESFVFDQINLRRWPAATQFQSIIEALLEVLADNDLDIAEISQARVSLPTDVYEAFGGFGWEDKFNARLSPRYVTAVVLADGRCWVEQFQQERLEDPDVTGFAGSKVVVKADQTLHGVGARVEIDTGSGVFTATCPVPKGDAQRPLPRDEIVAKFHDAREGLFDDGRADEIVDGILGLDDVDDVRPLIRLLGAVG